jgi:hypothetical protein
VFGEPEFFKQDVSSEKQSSTASVGTDPEVRVLFQALPDFQRSSGSGKGSTQPREYSYLKEKVTAAV